MFIYLSIHSQLYLSAYSSILAFTLYKPIYLPSIHLSSFFQFVYTGDDFEDEYSGSRLDFLLVFHTADQQEEMKKKIVIPLSEEFRLHYAFILIDG